MSLRAAREETLTRRPLQHVKAPGEREREGKKGEEGQRKEGGGEPLLQTLNKFVVVYEISEVE